MSKEEIPSNCFNDFGSGITPRITSHGDVNFFEKSFEKALDSANKNENDESPLGPTQSIPRLNANLKPTSIQLISPPSDGAFVLNKEDYLKSNEVNVASKFSPSVVQISEPRPQQPQYQFIHTNKYAPSIPVVFEQPAFNYRYPGNYAASPAATRPPIFNTLPTAAPIEMFVKEGASDNWLANVQKVKAESLEKQLKSQEKNRLAAMKSRQRKKKEWERLVESEHNLLAENQTLKQRIAQLELELNNFKANSDE